MKDLLQCQIWRIEQHKVPIRNGEGEVMLISHTERCVRQLAIVSVFHLGLSRLVLFKTECSTSIHLLLNLQYLSLTFYIYE